MLDTVDRFSTTAAAEKRGNFEPDRLKILKLAAGSRSCYSITHAADGTPRKMRDDIPLTQKNAALSKGIEMEQAMQVFVDWTALMVPALAVWAVIGIHVYRSEGHSAVVDTLYFVTMAVIGALTWRTMAANDCCWLIHTASLGTMIVGGVLPKRETPDEAFSLISQLD